MLAKKTGHGNTAIASTETPDLAITAPGHGGRRTLIGGALLFGISLFAGAHYKDGPTTARRLAELFPYSLSSSDSWRPGFGARLYRSLGWSFLDALCDLLVSLAAAAIVMREGVVCLVIVSPALYVFILYGLLLGRVWFRPNYSKLQLTIFPLLALLTLGESVYHSEQQAVVTDQILIHAPRRTKSGRTCSPSPKFPTRRTTGFSGSACLIRRRPPTAATSSAPTANACSATASSSRNAWPSLIPNEKLTFDIAEQPTASRSVRPHHAPSRPVRSAG